MLSCLSCFEPSTRNGLGSFSLNDLYNSIAIESGSGSATLGEIAEFLLNTGLTIEAARNALNTVAANVGSNPQQLAAINAELNYLNTYGADGLGYRERNNWIVPALVVGALVLWAMNEKR